MEKQSQEEAEAWRKIEVRRQEMKKIRKGDSKKREDAGARKGRKVANTLLFPMICGPGGSKSRLAKAAGAEPAGQMNDEKLHAVVARSTLKNTTCPKHFWKLRC